jgi:hypothetical protein
MDSDDEIQQIDPPVIIWYERKKYRRKILKEELNPRFCGRSKRYNNNVENLKDEDCIDTIHVSVESSHSLENPASR